MHNFKSIHTVLKKVQKETKLTDDEILIMIMCAIDYDYFTSLLIEQKRIIDWFVIDSSGDNTDEIDFLK